MSSADESWSKRFNRALREARGVVVEQSGEDRPDDTMSGLIRSAVDKKRSRVDQDLDDRGGSE